MPPLRGCSPINDVNCTDVFCCYPTPITATQVRCTKFLGLHIDDHLEWDIHINHCKSKVSMAKNILSGKHLRILHNSLVHPYLSYGNLLWGNSYKKYINKLEILQKKAIRCMSKAVADIREE